MGFSILKDKLIVLDTNVLLHIYSYSPEISEFAIKCLEAVIEDLVIPQTVAIEYRRHQGKAFKKMSNKISSAKNITFIQLKKLKAKLYGVNKELKKLQLPDVEFIDEVINEKWDDIQKEFENYFEDREPTLNMLSNAWGKTDKVLKLYEEIEKLGHIIQLIDQGMLFYNLCDTAEKRYEKKIPPGYKDKDKKGNSIRKYGDFLIWWEIIQYAKDKQMDVLFVTDDVKEDWCSIVDEDTICLREELKKEFFQSVKKTIRMINSKELYSLIADKYKIDKPDIVEYALNYTNSMYCKSISESIFEKAEEYLVYSDTEFINVDTANIGNLGLSDDGLEVLDWKYVSGVQLNREDDLVGYELTYDIRVAAYSSDYWGRDDDTKDIISSPYSYHEFEGQFKVIISRRVDAFIDFEDDLDYEFIEYYEGNLEEVKFRSYNEIACEKNYNCCPDCGVELTFENDGGNGFCNSCAWKH